MSNEKRLINPELAKKPVLDEQPTDLIHTRRNLLIVSSIFLFSVIAGVELQPKFFNDNFTNGQLTKTDIYIAILLTILYLFISFYWKFRDYSHSQVILSTKDIELYFAPKIGTVTETRTYRDPKQYSLSGWWSRTSDSIQVFYERIEEAVNNLEKETNISKQLNEIKRNTDAITHMYQAASNDDVVNSLRDFDKSTIRFLYNQQRRVFFLDYIFPIMMTLTAFYFLVEKLAYLNFFNFW